MFPLYYAMRTKRKAHPKECASNYEKVFKSEFNANDILSNPIQVFHLY